MTEYTIIPIHKKCIVKSIESKNCMTVDASKPETARDAYMQHINFNLNENLLLIFPSYYGYIAPIVGDVFFIKKLSKGWIRGKYIQRHGEQFKE